MKDFKSVKSHSVKLLKVRLSNICLLNDLKILNIRPLRVRLKKIILLKDIFKK